MGRDGVSRRHRIEIWAGIRYGSFAFSRNSLPKKILSTRRTLAVSRLECHAGGPGRRPRRSVEALGKCGTVKPKPRERGGRWCEEVVQPRNTRTTRKRKERRWMESTLPLSPYLGALGTPVMPTLRGRSHSTAIVAVPGSVTPGFHAACESPACNSLCDRGLLPLPSGA